MNNKRYTSFYTKSGKHEKSCPGTRNQEPKYGKAKNKRKHGMQETMEAMRNQKCKKKNLEASETYIKKETKIDSK